MVPLARYLLSRPVALPRSHDAPIAKPVWELFRHLVARIGPRPAPIERDDNLPPFAERDRAAAMLADEAAHV